MEKKKKLPLCLNSLPAMRALVVLAIVLLAITTPCSEVQAAAHGTHSTHEKLKK